MFGRMDDGSIAADRYNNVTGRQPLIKIFTKLDAALRKVHPIPAIHRNFHPKAVQLADDAFRMKRIISLG